MQSQSSGNGLSSSHESTISRPSSLLSLNSKTQVKTSVELWQTKIDLNSSFESSYWGFTELSTQQPPGSKNLSASVICSLIDPSCSHFTNLLINTLHLLGTLDSDECPAKTDLSPQSRRAVKTFRESQMSAAKYMGKQCLKCYRLIHLCSDYWLLYFT